MSGGKKAVNLWVAISAAVAIGSGHAHAQQAAPAAKSGTLSFSSTLEIQTNPNLSVTSPGTQITFDETLGFSLSSETRNQTLTASGSGGLDYSVGALGTSSNFTQPTVRLGYRRDSANSGLDASYSYWNGDVVSSFDNDPTSAINIVVARGFLTKQNGSVTLDLGRQAPLSAQFSASQSINDYSGRANPNIFDETTTSYQASAGLRFSGVTQGDVTLRYTDYDAQDPFSTKTRTTDLILGLSHELRRGLVIDASIGGQQQTVRQLGIPSDFTGFSAALSLTQAMPDGSVFGDLTYDSTGGSKRTALSFGRSIDLPSGAISGSLTAANVDGNGVQLYGSAGYSRSLSDGSLDLQLNQSVSKDQSNNDVLRTNVNVAYAKQINQASAVDVSLDFLRSEDGGAGSVPTQSRGTFVAQVNQQLTTEWDMAYGYRFRFYDDQTSDLRGSNSVFVTVTRNFQFNF